MKYFLRRQWFQISSFTALILLLTGLPSSGQGVSPAGEIYGRQAELLVPGAAMIIERPGTTFPSQVRMTSGSFIPVGEFESFLRSNFPFTGEYAFILIKSTENQTGLGLDAYRLDYKNIPIEHATILAHTRNGMVERFGGFADFPESVKGSPAITEDVALEAAKNGTGARKYLGEVKGELIFVKGENPGNEISAGYRLAWQFDIREAESILDRRIFIDAETGELIKWYPLVYDCDAGSVPTTWHGTQSISTDYIGADDNYILLDDCGAASIHTILEAGNAEIADVNNNWNESDRTDYATTHFYARVTMDYYQAVHSRASYDGADGDLLLRHVAAWSNASYIGGGTLRVGMNTGNQGEFYNTLDVISHEFTHAVTDNNGLGGLVYQGESGALNESFSDILGEAAEMWYEAGNYPIDWLHREDYVGGENRSLLAPKDQGQPDTYLGDNWANTCGGCDDDGGVHTNSGVMNHWFYLVAAGGAGTNDNDDDYSVSGIGVVKTREIAYRMLTEEMTSNATYPDARNAAINIAIDIYGNCSFELKQVMNAWYAVGVGNPYCEAVLESPEYNGGYNISCTLYSDGAINLTTLGTGPFTVVWDDDPATGNRSGLSAGTYTVTITDATGCSDTKSITLTEPPQLIASAVVTSDYNGYAVSCNGASDGVATASAVGGVPPYYFLWDANAGNQNTAVATGLSAGSYLVSATDANGCVFVTQVTLDEPPVLTIEAGDNQTVYFGYPPAACATLSYSGAGGGVPPYSYEWSTAESSQDISVCPEVSTMYYITITDANNCTATDSVIVCAIDVRCGKKLDKVELCHIPPDDPLNPQTICVALISVAEHLAHGDMLAACGTDHSCTDLEPKSQAILSGPPLELPIILEASPNPALGSAKVKFSTDSDGQASLELYDSFGRVLITLFNGQVISYTSYNLQLNTGLYPAGIYYLMLRQSNGSSRVLKIVISK